MSFDLVGASISAVIALWLLWLLPTPFVLVRVHARGASLGAHIARMLTSAAALVLSILASLASTAWLFSSH